MCQLKLNLRLMFWFHFLTQYLLYWQKCRFCQINMRHKGLFPNFVSDLFMFTSFLRGSTCELYSGWIFPLREHRLQLVLTCWHTLLETSAAAQISCSMFKSSAPLTHSVLRYVDPYGRLWGEITFHKLLFYSSLKTHVSAYFSLPPNHDDMKFNDSSEIVLLWWSTIIIV